MSTNTRLRTYLYACVAAGAISLPATSAFAVCQGPGAPTDTQTKCVTAVTIPGNPLQSFDISWTDPNRAEYYLADRSNKGIDIIDTNTLTFKRTIGGFVGQVFNATGTKINNDVSGPDGVVNHGHWLYAGDGNSTLKVIDLNDLVSPIKASIPTGGTNRVDEMAITTDGTRLIAANNADAPAFATLFKANGDAAANSTSIIARIDVDPTILGGGSIEQPTWVPGIARFVVSVPQIANNPTGCTPDGAGGTPICQGGLLYVDPTITAHTVLGAFNPATNTGVLPLHDCGPNGASTGPHNNVILGCTPQNVATNTTTQVINVKTRNFVEVGNITGSDEVWFNKGDDRYYTGSNRDCANAGTPCPAANQQAAKLGVISAASNLLIEKIPQSSGSHSVAADAKRNLIFVPQVCALAPPDKPGHPANIGCDTTTVGQQLCGGTAGCVAVYKHDVDEDDEAHNGDHQGDDDHG